MTLDYDFRRDYSVSYLHWEKVHAQFNTERMLDFAKKVLGRSFILHETTDITNEEFEKLNAAIEADGTFIGLIG